VLLAEESGIRIVGEAVNFGEAISKASTLKPNALLLDLHMPDDRWLEPEYIKANLHPLDSQVKIIGMSLSGNDEETRNVGESLGVLAILEKQRFYTELIPAILRCAALPNPQATAICFRPRSVRSSWWRAASTRTCKTYLEGVRPNSWVNTRSKFRTLIPIC
jgi:DNA-binding NarL/FixJ family response regulator